jgi:hypothetical protein
MDLSTVAFSIQHSAMKHFRGSKSAITAMDAKGAKQSQKHAKHNNVSWLNAEC